jgi:predicted nucleic acid-binding protein
MGDLYLLDTNVLVHYVRSDEVWARIQARYSLLLADPRPMICVVTAGELRSLAFQFNWQALRLSQMDFIVNYFDWVNIDRRSVLESYALIDAHSQSIGRKMGKNDLWIAAATRALGATLLTTDRDFDPIHPGLIQREWIDPTPPAGTP